MGAFVYEWDDTKAASNIVKHHISFLMAPEVFRDLKVYVTPTIREVDREKRYKAVGRVGEKLYAVIYVETGNVRRIISVRRTNIKEDRAYADRQIHP
jgi:uncharacterized DUF497 family protein